MVPRQQRQRQQLQRKRKVILPGDTLSSICLANVLSEMSAKLCTRIFSVEVSVPSGLATNTVSECNAHGLYTAGASSTFICHIMWGFLNSIVTSKGLYYLSSMFIWVWM